MVTDQRADDIKAMSDDVATDAEDLAAIETEKGRLEVDDPRLIELAREAEDLATDVLTKTRAERQLVTDAAGLYGGGASSDRSGGAISDTSQ